MTLNKTLDEMHKALKSLHETNDRMEEERKAYGKARQEDTEHLKRISDEITSLEKKIEEVQLEKNRKHRLGEEAMTGQTPEELAKKEAFLKYVRKGGDVNELSPEERKAIKDTDARFKALVEDSYGEIIVPEAVDTEITKALHDQTVLRQLARVVTISSNRLKRYAFNALKSGYGKLETSYKQDGGQNIYNYESDIRPNEMFINVHNLYGYTEIGEDLLMDSEFSLEQMLVEMFAESMNYAENWHFLNGTGDADVQPEGILNAKGINRIKQEGEETPLDAILNLQYAVDAPFRANGAYLYSSAAELLVRTTKNENGDYMWQPPVQLGKPATLFGHPAYVQDTFEGDAAVVFGDFKRGYTIVDNAGTAIRKYDQAAQAMESDAIPFRAKRRNGGGVSDPRALAILEMDVPEILGVQGNHNEGIPTPGGEGTDTP